MGNSIPNIWYITGQVDNRVVVLDTGKLFACGPSVGLRHPLLSQTCPNKDQAVHLPLVRNQIDVIVQWVNCKDTELERCHPDSYRNMRSARESCQATFIGYKNLFGNFVSTGLFQVVKVSEESPFALPYALK